MAVVIDYKINVRDASEKFARETRLNLLVARDTLAG
jgi:hypothetical protein